MKGRGCCTLLFRDEKNGRVLLHFFEKYLLIFVHNFLIKK